MFHPEPILVPAPVNPPWPLPRYRYRSPLLLAPMRSVLPSPVKSRRERGVGGVWATGSRQVISPFITLPGLSVMQVWVKAMSAVRRVPSGAYVSCLTLMDPVVPQPRPRPDTWIP